MTKEDREKLASCYNADEELMDVFCSLTEETENKLRQLLKECSLAIYDIADAYENDFAEKYDEIQAEHTEQISSNHLDKVSLPTYFTNDYIDMADVLADTDGDNLTALLLKMSTIANELRF